MINQLIGTGVALITPFTKDNQVDTEALTRIVDYVTEGGVEFIVVLGTTSEAPTLTKDEKRIVRETIIKANKGRLPLVLGIGGNNTQNVIDEIKQTDLSPFVAILGGAKVSDKITVIENLIEKVDSIIIGGGMAFTFLKSLGYSVGKSLLEEDKIDLAKDLYEKAKSKNVNMLLPVDVVVSKEFSNDSDFKTVTIDSIEEDYMGLDIGYKTVELFSDEIKKAKTVVWNGPMGVFEMPNFAKGTFEIAKAIAETDSISIIGGGDSASAAEKSGFKDKITHISTGGGASLEFLEGKILPGIDAIDNK